MVGAFGFIQTEPRKCCTGRRASELGEHNQGNTWLIDTGITVSQADSAPPRESDCLSIQQCVHPDIFWR